jgi:hypothetical protein
MQRLSALEEVVCAACAEADINDVPTKTRHITKPRARYRRRGDEID